MTTSDDTFEWEDKKEDTDFQHHMIAGSIAGIAEHVCMLPFDNVKVSIQYLYAFNIMDMYKGLYYYEPIIIRED